MRKIIIQRMRKKPLQLEQQLRQLFAMDRLYTIDDLVKLTGHGKQYVRSKISALQNARYTPNPISIKWIMCFDNVKRLGNESADQICDLGERE